MSPVALFVVVAVPVASLALLATAAVSLIRRTRSLRAAVAGRRERIAAELAVLERESAAASRLLRTASHARHDSYTDAASVRDRPKREVSPWPGWDGRS